MSHHPDNALDNLPECAVFVEVICLDVYEVV